MIGRLKEVDRDLSTVPTGSCRVRKHLGSVFDHPLFSWSNYDSNKSPTTDVKCQNMDLGYRAILFICFRKAYYREKVNFFYPTLSRDPLAIRQPCQSATAYLLSYCHEKNPRHPNGGHYGNWIFHCIWGL
ncbi:hypothetical protein AVEN_36319-1 [Araneus ventricosus]|uniref:Uncharacterized protein n=1 Tax=Araneus ventricosus TaxID=182803 RepID=A0A4Y2GIU9_ARAVE|nr:hypothetical protein AVEN_36319-1 [Araneus ventricosus]